MRLPSFFKDSKNNQCDLANQEKILIREMKYYELQVRERRETTPKYKAGNSWLFARLLKGKTTWGWVSDMKLQKNPKWIQMGTLGELSDSITGNFPTP